MRPEVIAGVSLRVLPLHNPTLALSYVLATAGTAARLRADARRHR